MLTLSNTDSQVSKRSKHRKTYQDKIAHVVEEPKKTDSRLFFALNGVLEKIGNVSLKVLENSLDFLFKKGTNPVLINKRGGGREVGKNSWIHLCGLK